MLKEDMRFCGIQRETRKRDKKDERKQREGTTDSLALQVGCVPIQQNAKNSKPDFLG
jgi:hypothetical protein